MNATKYARIAEVTSLDGSIAVTLAAHQAIGLKVNRYFSITSNYQSLLYFCHLLIGKLWESYLEIILL